MTTNQILLELLRSAVLDRDPNLPKDVVVNWDELMDISSRHGVLAWVWDGICKLPVGQQPPRQQRINWALSAQEIWNRYHRQKAVLSEMVEVCNKNDMRLLLLKGIGLSELYPKPESRPSGDIDFFLFGDYEKGNRLFSEGKSFHETDLHSELTYHGIAIENHKTIVYPNSKVKRAVSEYLLANLDKVELSPKGYYELSPLQNLPYLMMHSLNHVNYGNGASLLPIRHIIDLGIYLKNHQSILPQSIVFQLMDRLGLFNSFQLIVHLIESMLDIDLNEYKCGMLSAKALNTVQLVSNSLMEDSVSSECSYIDYSKALWTRYHRLKSIADFIPIKPGNSLFHCTVRMYFYPIINKICR